MLQAWLSKRSVCWVLAPGTGRTNRRLRNIHSSAIHVFALRGSKTKYTYRLLGKWGFPPRHSVWRQGRPPSRPPAKSTMLTLWTARGPGKCMLLLLNKCLPDQKMFQIKLLKLNATFIYSRGTVFIGWPTFQTTVVSFCFSKIKINDVATGITIKLPPKNGA